jgi:hypothetical protein
MCQDFKISFVIIVHQSFHDLLSVSSESFTTRRVEFDVDNENQVMMSHESRERHHSTFRKYGALFQVILVE